MQSFEIERKLNEHDSKIGFFVKELEVIPSIASHFHSSFRFIKKMQIFGNA